MYTLYVQDVNILKYYTVGKIPACIVEEHHMHLKYMFPVSSALLAF